MDNKNAFEVPACNIPALKKEIERLGRRAVKLRLTPITIQISPESHPAERVVPFTRDDEYAISEAIRNGALGAPQPRKVTIPCHWVTVTGASPKVDGWRFGATLDHLPTGGTLIRCAPGQEVPAEEWSAAKPLCSHCKTNRIRKDTFVLIHDDGRKAQIGRNCLKDFLGGHADPESLARWAQELERLLESMGGFGAVRDFDHRYCIEADLLLALVVQSIRLRGFLSKAMAQSSPGRTPTSSDAMACYWRLTSKDEKDRNSVTPPTDQDRALGKEALEWMKAQEPRGDFMANLVTLARAGLRDVEHRHVGLLAAGVQSFLKDKAVQSTRVKYGDSKHVGEAKKRGNMELVVRSVRRCTSQYDDSSFDIVKFGDKDGNLYSWLTSAILPEGMEEGKVLEVRATVKAHSEYKGVKETRLTRVSIVKVIGNAPAPEMKATA